MTTTTPRTFSHIGLSVSDLNKAVEFYRDVLGFYVIMPPTLIKQDETDIGVMCNGVFGQGWGKFRIAHLATADRIGVELFEFVGNHAPANNLQFRQIGMFHFAIQDPDVEGLLAKIVAAGGRQRIPVREYFPGNKPTTWSMLKIPSASSSSSTRTPTN